MSNIPAAICLISVGNDQWLIQIKDSNFPDKYEFCKRRISLFGGAKEADDISLHDALLRELKEELPNTTILVDPKIEIGYGTWPNGEITEWHMYVAYSPDALSTVFAPGGCQEGLPLILSTENIIALIRKGDMMYPGIQELLWAYLGNGQFPLPN